MWTRGWALWAAEPNGEALVFPDNTANITVKHGYFDRERAKVHHLPILISDNGRPSLTGTSTLHVTVCKCNERGEFTLCEEMGAQVGVSIQALVAIFLCILTIAGQCPGGREGTLMGLHRRRRGLGSRPGPASIPAPRTPPWASGFHVGVHGCRHHIPGCLRVGMDKGEEGWDLEAA